jgi:AraC-like DNA-binding protein
MKKKEYTRNELEAVAAYKKLLDLHRFVGDYGYEICRQYGINRNTLQALFKELHGITIRQYKLKVRMERGRDLLKKGMSVKRVSILLRYTTPRAFVTAFRKQFGISPGRWAEARRP